MSKSLGNIVDPNDLCDVFGPEAVRYYLVRDTKTGYDSDYDAERMKMIYNTELANDLGNLCNRSLNMCTRYLGGTVTVSAEPATDELSVALRQSMADTVTRFTECMNAYNTSEALAALNAHVGQCNAFIEKTQPFALAKDEARLPELQSVLAHLLESCVQVGYLIACVLPDASARILSQLQVDAATLSPQTLVWGILKDGHAVQAPSPVFPRILSEEEKQKMAEKAAKAAAKAARKAAAQQQ
jgi:methionyl-tRNA synthetase